MSQDLQWLLLKDNTCFIHKQKSNGSTFTSEPNNLTQLNAFKYSGLCNNKTVGVAVSNGKVTLSLKRPKKANRPSKSQAVTVITKHQANGRAAGAEAIKTATAKSHYRGDLAKTAIARYHKLRKGLKPANVGVIKKGRRNLKAK